MMLFCCASLCAARGHGPGALCPAPPQQSSARNTSAIPMLPGFHRGPSGTWCRVQESLSLPCAPRPPPPPHMLFPGGCRRPVQMSLCLHQARLWSPPSLALPLQGTGLAGALLGASSLVCLGCGCSSIRARKYREETAGSPLRGSPSPGPPASPAGPPSQPLWLAAAPKERAGHARAILSRTASLRRFLNVKPTLHLWNKLST